MLLCRRCTVVADDLPTRAPVLSPRSKRLQLQQAYPTPLHHPPTTYPHTLGPHAHALRPSTGHAARSCGSCTASHPPHTLPPPTAFPVSSCTRPTRPLRRLYPDPCVLLRTYTRPPARKSTPPASSCTRHIPQPAPPTQTHTLHPNTHSHTPLMPTPPASSCTRPTRPLRRCGGGWLRRRRRRVLLGTRRCGREAGRRWRRCGRRRARGRRRMGTARTAWRVSAVRRWAGLMQLYNCRCKTVSGSSGIVVYEQ